MLKLCLTYTFGAAFIKGAMGYQSFDFIDYNMSPPRFELGTTGDLSILT